MTRVALLRHFPTDWNGERRLQGRTDRPLTAEARALLAGLALPPGWEDADIVASPLSRATETALLLARGRRIRIEPRLAELSWGAWEGRTADDLLSDPASGFRPTGDLGWRDRPPGGESAADAWERAAPALRRIAELGRPAVLVTHKALMRVILGRAWRWRGPEGGTVGIRRARLYPLLLGPGGEPRAPGEPLRLVPREASGAAAQGDAGGPPEGGAGGGADRSTGGGTGSDGGPDGGPDGSWDGGSGGDAGRDAAGTGGRGAG